MLHNDASFAYGSRNGSLCYSGTNFNAVMDSSDSGKCDDSSIKVKGLFQLAQLKLKEQFASLVAIMDELLMMLHHVVVDAVPPKYDLNEISAPAHVCLTDFEPRIEHSLSESIQGCSLEPKREGELKFASLNGVSWNKSLSFLDANAVMKNTAKGLGYIDKKYIFLSSGVGSSISLPVSVSATQSPVWICEVK